MSSAEIELEDHTVEIEPLETYHLKDPAANEIESTVKLTGVGDNKAYGVIHGQSGELITLEPLDELVREGRLIPTEEETRTQ
ncbi:MAG: hypothetical protein SVG88_03895 [Halobacteriales archaeon]|nr:hypothetical protein [Halobacteriales archaeon]